MSNDTSTSSIFLVAGRTGGPLMPVLAMADDYPDSQPIIVGIKGGFEDRIAIERSISIVHLPEAKFTIFSFSNNDWYDWIKEVLLTLWNGVLLLISIIISLFLLLKYKPTTIITAGGFVAVPLVLASRVTNFIRQTHVTIVMHQQDPQPGLSNKIVGRFADTKTCVFDYTKQHYPSFADCTIIPNPVDTRQFTPEFQKKLWRELKTDESDLYAFLHQLDESKPLMLVFGGGGGAYAMNRWMVKNAEEILEHFSVIHLTGALQQDEFASVDRPDYIRLTGLWKYMPLAMKLADIVVCRAGMGSIGELTYLNKPGFLIPLPHSHQELNAELVQDQANFTILPQTIIKKRPGKERWLEDILTKMKTMDSTHQQDTMQKREVRKG